MIINKTTSDTLLVNSLVIKGATGGFISGVSEFDTDTLVASLEGGGTAAAKVFYLIVDEEDAASLIALLPTETNPFSEEEEPIAALLGVVLTSSQFSGKKAMAADSSPDHYHEVLGPVSPYLVECSNCGTKFVVYFARGDKVYQATRASPSDKHLTATEIADPVNYTCDSCSETVSMLRP